MKRLAYALLGLGAAALAVAPGCGVPLSERVVEVTNRCETDADCGVSGRCVEKTCVTTAADLDEVVIQVDVPPSSPYAPGTTHVRKPSAQGVVLSGESGPFYRIYDFELWEQVDVVVSMAVADLPPACAEQVGNLPQFADGQGRIPIRAELSPTAFELGPIPAGVPTTVYDASAPPERDEREVKLSVPTGTYDVYVTPLVPVDELGSTLLEGCDLPPRLLSIDILPSADDEPVVIALDVDAAPENPDDNIIEGSIEGPDLTNWTVDLLENKKGRLVSTHDVLDLSGEQTPSGFTLTRFTLTYWAANGSPQDKVLRLTPPETKAAEGMPVFYWRLQELPGYAANVSAITPMVNDPIAVNAIVVVEDTPERVPAIVTIHSEELSLSSSVPNVLYRRTVQTDSEGKIEDLNLFPGRYTVIIQPLTDDTLAVTTTEHFELTSEDLGGKTFHVQRKQALTGSAVTAQGVAASRMNTVIEPTVPSEASYLQSVRKSLPVLPGIASTLTNDQGAFSLVVDPGEFNLSIRPESGTNLPWAVLSRFTIDPLVPLSTLQLGIPNPVILYGQVRGETQSIAGARIRAWISPTSPSAEEDANAPDPTVIQIAETTSGPDGSFRLFLPASIAASVSQ